jgi:hypothetical protein
VSLVLSTLRIDREIRELLGAAPGSRPDDRRFLGALERRVLEIARRAPSVPAVAPGASPGS